MAIRAATPEDAPAIARVHVDSWRTTYRGLLPDQVLAGLSVPEREASWLHRLEASVPNSPSGSVFVAEDPTGEIVGFAAGGPSRGKDSAYAGELYAIYVLQEHQRKGIGRSIMNRVVEELRAFGCGSMVVWVLKGNPAERFYRHLGGKPSGEKIVRISGEDYLEIAYGWKNLEVLEMMARIS